MGLPPPHSCWIYLKIFCWSPALYTRKIPGLFCGKRPQKTMTRVASSRELLHQSSTLIEVDDAGAIGSAARCHMCLSACAPRTCKTSSAAACSPRGRRRQQPALVGDVWVVGRDRRERHGRQRAHQERALGAGLFCEAVFSAKLKPLPHSEGTTEQPNSTPHTTHLIIETSWRVYAGYKFLPYTGVQRHPNALPRPTRGR